MVVGVLFILIFIVFNGYRAYVDFNAIGDYENRTAQLKTEYNTTPLSWQDFNEAFQHIHQFLYSNFEFYRSYTLEDQKEFSIRVFKFIENKRIVGMEEFEMTDEIKILVSIPAIRLTFGLDHFYLPTLKTIGVYPSIFYNRMIRKEVKGITFKSGVMYLSYEHLIDGNKTETDRINLGLHEMAHAFKIYIEQNVSIFSVLYDEMQEFNSHAEVMIELVRSGELSYFRNYAGVNSHEFFAVSIENFFEEAENFKLYMPETYHMLSNILNIKTA
jgi:Mlc titration factor MtfA (ptsG expression regulator)